MISDEERRNLANSLRHDAAYEEGSPLEWWGRLQFIVLDEDDFPKPKELFEKLADLIDRPQCHPVEVSLGYGDMATGCSVCGRPLAINPFGGEGNRYYRRCVHCGAEVVR